MQEDVNSLFESLRVWLQRGVDAYTLEKGSKYFSQGRVLHFSQNAKGFSGMVSGKLLYRVEFEKGRDGGYVYSCTCPVDGVCKHVVALVKYALSQEAKGVKEVVELPPSSVEVKNSLSVDLTAWFGKKEESQKGELRYFFSERWGNTLEVQLAVCKRKKNGEIGLAKSWQGSPVTMNRFPPEAVLSVMAGRDEEIWRLLLVEGKEGRYSLEVIREMLLSERAFWNSESPRKMQWEEAPKKGEFVWDVQEGERRKLVVELLESHLQVWNTLEGILAFEESSCTCFPVDCGVPSESLQKILALPPFDARETSMAEQQLRKLFPNMQCRSLQVTEVNSKDRHVKLRLQLGMSGGMEGSLYFVYGGVSCFFPLSGSKEMVRRGDVLYQVQRDLLWEKSQYVLLQNSYWASGHTHEFLWYSSKSLLMSWLLDRAIPAGWEIEYDSNFPFQGLHTGGEWYVALEEKERDWFDAQMGIIVDGKRIDLLPLLMQMGGKVDLQGEVVITGKDRQSYVLEGKVLENLLSHIDALFPEKKEGVLRVSRWDVGTLDSLEKSSAAIRWEVPPSYRTLLQNFSGIENKKIPATLAATLRPYQEKGFAWLQFLSQAGLGGVLADDMGLGKTVQTIAHILAEKDKGLLEGHPALIVSPTSVLPNWERELARFAPSLRVLSLQGAERKGQFEEIVKQDVVLTTYPLLARDKEALSACTYHLLILDEAQNVKNAKTLAYQALQSLQAHHRICLTGTPLENHLGELWALFHFLMPGFLGSLKNFTQSFRNPIEKKGSLEKKLVLQKRIRPFFLRRTKGEIALDLPPKTEMTTRVILTPLQRDLYEAVRLTMMKKVMSYIDSKGLSRSRIVVLEALLKLRQVCCDPRLANKEKKSSPEDSAKLLYFRENIPLLLEQGRRILLFSQFTSMLSLIEEELQKMGVFYSLLTGETQDRREPIRRFQEGETPIFLISLKAGGTGLNLTAADTVIHYDPWWNPAVEAQATDRAHRMGQEKPVFVYRWIAEGTVEEKILALQERKRKLAASLFEEDAGSPFELEKKDLEDIFAPLQ